MEKIETTHHSDAVADGKPITDGSDAISNVLTDTSTFGKYTLTTQGLLAEDGAVVTTLSDGVAFTIHENTKPVRFYHTWFLPVTIDGKDAVVDTSLQTVIVGRDECYDLVSLDPNDTMADEYGELMGVAYAANMPEVYYAATVRQGGETKECYVGIWGDGSLSVTKRKN